MKRRAVPLLVLIIAGMAVFLALTAPATWRLLRPARDVPDATAPDLQNGRTQFLAGDCATCHATPGKRDDTLLGGGRSLDTAFGVFHMPNISPDAADGIGGWTLQQFIAAMREGVLPHGGNAYPAFPYTSYQRMTANDLRDLFAYLKTLPAVAGKPPAHDLKFPYSVRRGVGAWRLAFLDGRPLPDAPGQSAEWLRGRYLVEGAGHCVECHSPRNALGAIPSGKRFSGGPDAERTGYVPNITSHETGIAYWSASDIATYLHEGVSPIGMKAGGDMKEVVANTARLSDADRMAMAVYLKTIPAVHAPNAGMPEPNRTDQVVMLKTSAQGAGGSKLESLHAHADALARAGTLYVVSPKPFSVARPAEGAAEDGKLLGAAAVTVLAREGGLMQVRLDGWQQEGSPSAFYALQGQRILQAVLSPEAIAQVVRTKTVRDAATGQYWHQGSLTVWVRNDAFNADLDQLWRHSRELYSHSCATCHALPHTGDFLANQWIGTLKAMRRYTSLDEAQYRLLLAWLQYHAKDTGAQADPQADPQADRKDVKS